MQRVATRIQNDAQNYSYYEKNGILFRVEDEGDFDGIINTYLLMNSEKKFDSITAKRKFLRQLRNDPNYTSEQIDEEEKKNCEWGYNGKKISMEEAEKVLNAAADKYVYHNKHFWIYGEKSIEKIKKDLTKLETGNDHIYDTSALENSLYEKFKQGKEKVYLDQTNWIECHYFEEQLQPNNGG